MSPYELSDLDAVEERFRRLIASEDLPAPDEVHKDRETGELTFRWHKRRLEVVVSPDDVAAG